MVVARSFDAAEVRFRPEADMTATSLYPIADQLFSGHRLAFATSEIGSCQTVQLEVVPSLVPRITDEKPH